MAARPWWQRVGDALLGAGRAASQGANRAVRKALGLPTPEVPLPEPPAKTPRGRKGLEQQVAELQRQVQAQQQEIERLRRRTEGQARAERERRRQEARPQHPAEQPPPSVVPGVSGSAGAAIFGARRPQSFRSARAAWQWALSNGIPAHYIAVVREGNRFVLYVEDGRDGHGRHRNPLR